MYRSIGTKIRWFDKLRLVIASVQVELSLDISHSSVEILHDTTNLINMKKLRINSISQCKNMIHRTSHSCLQHFFSPWLQHISPDHDASFFTMPLRRTCPSHPMWCRVFAVGLPSHNFQGGCSMLPKYLSHGFVHFEVFLY